MQDILSISKSAKDASIKALSLSEEVKNNALNKISEEINKNKNIIYDANKKDLEIASNLLNEGKITKSMFTRLKLDENKLNDMVQGIKDVAKLPEPVNKILFERDIADGITLKKVSCPIGVIAVIFEARPDVISQIVSLCLKTSNAVVLKGGSEAVNTNQTIFNIIKNVLSEFSQIPEGLINLVFSREDVKEILSMDKYINLIIPRGSNSLVKYIKENTKIPVLGHSDGICHIYIDEYADINKTVKICIDAKCQYPSACNSVETILVHKSLLNSFVPELISALREKDVEILADENIKNIVPCVLSASEEDWSTEYSDKKVSIKMVETLEEAINHINKYGSGHTDCIITENNDNAEYFMQMVDSAGVYKNISTRFADGFRYGFGAEVGISTNKTHARGPVGLDGLTIYKYKLYGSGDIVDDFILGKRKFKNN